MQTYFGTDPTPIINYTPQTIDEYIVVVNLPEDWEEVHQYIINENEIDGIPNRKINCSNDQPFSLRTSIYEMFDHNIEWTRGRRSQLLRCCVMSAKQDRL